MKGSAGSEQSGINGGTGTCAAAVAGIIKPGMLPVAAAHAVLHKYPGGIPVVGCRGGSPGVFPAQVELHERVVGWIVFSGSGVLAGYPDVANVDVVGCYAARKQQQRQGCKKCNCSLFHKDKDLIKHRYKDMIFFNNLYQKI